MNTPLCLARVLMLLVCISAPLAPCLAQAPIEPSWNGKYLSFYVKELGNPEPLQRQIACEAIGSMGSTAAAAVPDLGKLLDSKDMTDRIAAALALAKIGEASKPALPQLQKMTASADPNEKRVAYLAMEAIAPPATVVVVDFFSSAYVLSLLIALVAGSAVAFVLWKRRAPKKKKKKGPANPTETSAEANAPAGQPTGAQPASKAVEGAAPAQPAAPATSANASQYRKRVSRQLPGMESYIKEQEGPDAIKRDLARAQDEFRRVCDKQQELAKYFNSEELNKDPERMRQLRLENDELALRHFRLEVRVKALEVKMLEMLVDHGGASDPALRTRTEATIKQKWDDLRTLCETPAKTSWKGEQWVSVATASHAVIEDLRTHLASFDVTIAPRPTVHAESVDTPDANESLKHTAEEAAKSGGDSARGDAGSQSTTQPSDVIAGDPPRPAE